MKNELMTLYQQYNQAMTTADVDQLAQLLAPSFTLTHMTGYVQPRSEWLAQIKNGQMHYFKSEEQQVAIKATADGWQLTGQSLVTASIHGSGRHAWPLNTVMPIKSINGQLQIMQAIVTTY